MAKDNVIQEEENKVAEKVNERGEKLVTIRLPREKGKPEAEFVSVNERTWMIPVGKAVEVPECVAEAIRNAELMEEKAYEFNSSVQK